MGNFNKIMTGILVLLLITIGWLANEGYRDISNHRDFNGLYMKTDSQVKAMETAKGFDKYGDWICINTKGMTFSEVIETCQHEAGHEVFAEIIENYPEKIEEVMEVIKK